MPELFSNGKSINSFTPTNANSKSKKCSKVASIETRKLSLNTSTRLAFTFLKMIDTIRTLQCTISKLCKYPLTRSFEVVDSNTSTFPPPFQFVQTYLVTLNQFIFVPTVILSNSSIGLLKNC